MYTRYADALAHFWRHYPSLEYGLTFLIGICSRFHCAYLLLAALAYKRFSLLIVGFAYFYSLFLYPDFQCVDETWGTGVFRIREVKRSQTCFGSALLYRGTLLTFHTGQNIFHRLDCQVRIKSTKNRPLGTHDYLISHLSLRQKRPHFFTLKMGKNSTWTPLKGRSLAEWRFQIKEKMRTWARTHFQNRAVKHLITGLLIGQKQNQLQSFQFEKLGLSHLLVISGFHFAILSGLCFVLLKTFLPRKILFCCVICCMSLYFLYIGETASTIRSYIGILVYLGGAVLERKKSPLNALGVTLLFALTSQPMIVLDVGFQLSFSATFGILLLYSPFENWLRQFFPKRALITLKKLSVIDRCGSLLSTYLRKVLSLNLSVFLFTLPIVLFHFHQFTPISFFYNLFFPLLFSLLIPFIILSFAIPFLFPALEMYTSFLLRLVFYAPKKLLFSLGYSSFPQIIACGAFVIPFLWGIFLHFARLQRLGR